MATPRKYYIVPDGARVIWASQLAAEYRDGASIEALAAKYEWAPMTIRNALNQFIASARAPGKRRENAPTKSDKRHERMAEMRRAGMTYQQIGNEFGVTRERVRQCLLRIAAKNGESELIGTRKPEPHHRCPACGGPVHNAAQVHCSRDCWRAAIAERNAPLVKRVFDLRKGGHTWVECASIVGWDHTENGTGIVSFLKAHPLYSELSPEDHDLIFPQSKSRRFKASFADAEAAD